MDAPFSLSGVERAHACPASTALDQAYSVTEDGERGTVIHTFAKRVIQGMPRSVALSLVRVPEWRDTCELFDPLDALSNLRNHRAEVAYAIHAPTGAVRELGIDIERRYVTRDGEIPGSLDVESDDFDGMPVVTDWKTGHDEVTACEDNFQMQGYCYAVAEKRGADAVRGQIGYVRPSGKVHLDPHVFTRFDLDDYAEMLAETYQSTLRAAERIAAATQIHVATGSHCKWCPAIASCPAQSGLARTMLFDLEKIDGMMQAMTPGQLGAAWAKLAQIKPLVERIDESLKAMARQAPIPLGNGKELREIHFERSAFSRTDAVALLRKKGANDSEIASLEKTVPQSQVRALKVRSW